MKRFLRNVEASFLIWRTHTLDMIFKMLQISLSLLLIGFMLHQYISYCELNKQIERLMQNKDVYVLRDCNDNAWIDNISRAQYLESWNQLFWAIRDSSMQKIVLDNEQPIDIDKCEVEVIRTTKEFFDYYGICLEDESSRWKQDFNESFIQDTDWKETIKPAIVGASYKKIYKLGDIIISDSGEKFLIKGFLKKNQAYAVPTQSKEMNDLSNAVIIPINIDTSSIESIKSYVKNCLYITKNKSELLKIEKINRVNKLYDGYFCSYRSQLKIVQKDTLEGILQYGVFGGILFLFSMIGLGGMLLQILLEKEKEYAVHLLCGATISDVLIRLLFQIGVLLFIGTAGCFMVFKNILIRKIVFTLFISFLVLFFGFSKLRLQSNNFMYKLRRGE